MLQREETAAALASAAAISTSATPALKSLMILGFDNLSSQYVIGALSEFE
jgi:hypothetical protein